MRVRAGHWTGLPYDTKRAARSNIANRAFAAIAVNNAASGDVKAPQHAMFGGRTQPADLAAALATSMAERVRPTLLDVVVTRDPANMLPGVDSRTLEVKPGDRPV